MSIENLEKSEIEEMSDLKFARYILQKVLETVQYPTSPLLVETSKVIATKIRMAINTMERLDRPKLASWWTVEYLNAEGDKLIPSEMHDDELERIAALIARGYGSGMIQERSYEDE